MSKWSDRFRAWWAKEPFLSKNGRTDPEARAMLPWSEEEYEHYRCVLDPTLTSKVVLVSEHGLKKLFHRQTYSSIFTLMSWIAITMIWALKPDEELRIYWLMFAIVYFCMFLTGWMSSHSAGQVQLACRNRLQELNGTKGVATSTKITKEIKSVRNRIADYEAYRLRYLDLTERYPQVTVHKSKLEKIENALSVYRDHERTLIGDQSEALHLEQKLADDLEKILLRLETRDADAVLNKARAYAKDVERHLDESMTLDYSAIAETSARLSQFAERIAAREVARVEVE